MVLSEKEFKPKFKLLKIGGFSKVYFYNIVTMGKLTKALLFLELLPKKYAKLQQKVNLYLEQQINTSPVNYTLPPPVMLVTFGRSVCPLLSRYLDTHTFSSCRYCFLQCMFIYFVMQCRCRPWGIVPKSIAVVGGNRSTV